MSSNAEFSHIGLSCKDPLAIERFYSRYFGFRRVRVYAPGPGQVVVIRSGPFALELFPSTEPLPAPRILGAGPDYPGVRHIAFQIADLDAKLAEIGADAQVTLGPLDMSQFIPGMRVAWISDPEGNIVELNQGYVDDENPPRLEHDEQVVIA
jgi:glyoxylase I family protein